MNEIKGKVLRLIKYIFQTNANIWNDVSAFFYSSNLVHQKFLITWINKSLKGNNEDSRLNDIRIFSGLELKIIKISIIYWNKYLHGNQKNQQVCVQRSICVGGGIRWSFLSQYRQVGWSLWIWIWRRPQRGPRRGKWSSWLLLKMIKLSSHDSVFIPHYLSLFGRLIKIWKYLLFSF